MLVGCATAPAPRIPFEDAVGHEAGQPQTTRSLEAPLARFLATATKVRMGTAVGAPMPASQVKAWVELLDETDAFLHARRTQAWAGEAIRARLQLEAEFQSDAHVFGDVPREVSERAPRTLRALSRGITALTTRVRKVDPRGFAWPVAPLVVSSPYGARVHPIAGEYRFHAGIDLEAPLAHPVRAAEVGTVVFSAWNGAHGKQIELQHDAHWATRYSHLSTLLVRPGTVVKKGQVIGLAGDTGLATGPHVHFELREDGDALDPEMFLAQPGGPALMSAAP